MDMESRKEQYTKEITKERKNHRENEKLALQLEKHDPSLLLLHLKSSHFSFVIEFELCVQVTA